MRKGLLLLLLSMQGFSQQVLTIDEAVRLALENNFEIRIAANELRADQANNSLGNAGILPQVTAVVNDNNNIINQSLTRADGTVSSLNNAINNSINYGVNLGWTIFDGLGMFARYDQLKELEKLGRAELQLAVTGRVGDVMSTFYEIAQQQQQLAALDTAIVISRQRVELAQNRYSIGKGSKLDLLNAQVDLNTDTTSQLRQQEQLAISKIQLNELIGRVPETDFSVTQEITMNPLLQLPQLTSLAEKQNPQLQAQLINKRVSELQLRQAKAGRYPAITVNSGYVVAETRSSLGFATATSSRGFNYGFNARMNIFDGLNQRRVERVAKIEVENAQLQVEQQALAITSQLSQLYQTYLTSLRLVEIESANEKLARENLEITLEKYRIGTIAQLEIRTAQLNYINARVRHSNAQYVAKLSEIALSELAGSLVLSGQ
jgi:outer membrane protein